jgi:predicted permease
MTTIINDIKYSFRQLVKSPGFTSVAVISLALGIGANSAIFSIINGVLFKPLPVRNPQELRVINWAGSNISLMNSSYSGTGKQLDSGRECKASFSYPLYCRLRDEAQGFSEVFAYHNLGGVTSLVSDNATTAHVMIVSGNFFTGYGVDAFLGRTITPEDEGQGADPVAMITYRFWQQRFGLDPRVLGETISINQRSFTVVGVLAQRFRGLLPGDSTDVYVPMNTPAQLVGMSLTSPDHWWIQLMARMKPGVSDTQAHASCEGIFRQALGDCRAHVENPSILLTDGSRGPQITRERIARPFWLLLGAVALVLIIACANVAGMLLSRSTMQSRDMAVRAAIGARRIHLIRQSLVESLLLCGLAILLGLMLSFWIKQIVAGFLLGSSRQDLYDLRLDASVFLYTVGLSLGTTLLFGLIPAWCISGVNPLVGLGNTRTPVGRHARWGNALVSVQMGLSLLLVVFAGLLVQTLVNLQKANPGFDTEKLLIFNVNGREAGYEKRPCADLYDQLCASVATLPGVSTASLTSNPLAGGWWRSENFSIADRTEPSHRKWQALILRVGDNYFKTMGIPLLQGRTLGPQDTEDSTPAVVINRCFADTFFPHENPLGQHLGKFQIVGICGDTKFANIRDAVEPTMYYTHRQRPIRREAYVMARTILPPLSLSSAILQIVNDRDATLPVKDITTQALIIADTFSMEQLSTVLCLSLSVLGLLLAAVGLYGLMSYRITCRTLEIGLRMALGARPCDIARPVLRQALWLAMVGIAIGLPVALLLVRVLRSIVYDIKPHDPITLMASTVILLAVAMLAAWIPLRRAIKIDPMEALRYE